MKAKARKVAEQKEQAEPQSYCADALTEGCAFFGTHRCRVVRKIHGCLDPDVCPRRRRVEKEAMAKEREDPAAMGAFISHRIPVSPVENSGYERCRKKREKRKQR